MSLLPALDVNVRARRQCCILDVPLVLSRCGLLLAVRAARELDIWLARALWQILDNTEFYRAHPRLLLRGAGAEIREDGLEALPQIIGEWEQARLETDLLGLNMFWAGDARHESLLPKDVDKHLVGRFDRAVQELDLAWAGDDADYDPLRECHRDAVALAMALMPYAPIILTRRDAADGAGEPAICRYLAECGIPVGRAAAGQIQDLRANLGAVFARTGVTELTWGGLDAVALHVVAPRALMLGSGSGFDAEFADDSDLRADAPRAHDGAAAWWWALS